MLMDKISAKERRNRPNLSGSESRSGFTFIRRDPIRLVNYIRQGEYQRRNH